jgi:hypothetical protein
VQARQAPSYVVPGEPLLRAQTLAVTSRCRCGTRLVAGEACLGFAALPEVLRELLDPVPFCGVVCARAYLLEALELFEGSAASAVVRDRDEVHEALARLYASLTTAAF